MVNPMRGEASVLLNGRTYVVWFGWPGVTMLREKYGADFDMVVTQAMQEVDLPRLAEILAIGLRDSWPGIQPEQIVDLSPPVRVIIDAIATAIRRTFYGMEEPEPVDPPRAGWLKESLRKIWYWRPTKLRSLPG